MCIRDRAVNSPMTAADHVKAIHVFTEKNPQPYVISVARGPRAGLASISTRIRLRDSQTVLAVAEMSDGTFWSGRAAVIVTVSDCQEDVLCWPAPSSTHRPRRRAPTR